MFQQSFIIAALAFEGAAIGCYTVQYGISARWCEEMYAAGRFDELQGVCVCNSSVATSRQPGSNTNPVTDAPVTNPPVTDAPVPDGPVTNAPSTTAATSTTTDATVTYASSTTTDAEVTGSTTYAPYSTTDADVTESTTYAPYSTTDADVTGSTTYAPYSTSDNNGIESTTYAPYSTTDADVTGSTTASTTTDADVTGSTTASTTTDADVTGSTTASTTTDADVTGSTTASTTTDADNGIESTTYAPYSTTDADVTASTTASTTTDADVTGSTTASTTTDADVTGSTTASTTTDADVTEPESTSNLRGSNLSVQSDVTSDAQVPECNADNWKDWCIGKVGPVGSDQYNPKASASVINHWGCVAAKATAPQWFEKGVTAAQKAAGVTSLGLAHSLANTGNNGNAITCNQCYIAAVEGKNGREIQLVRGVDHHTHWPETGIYDWADWNWVANPTLPATSPVIAHQVSPYWTLIEGACGKNSPAWSCPTGLSSQSPPQNNDTTMHLNVFLSGIVDCDNPQFDLSKIGFSSSTGTLLI